MLKYFALPRLDGGVEIMQMPPHSVRLSYRATAEEKAHVTTEQIRYKGGRAYVLRAGAWLPIEEIGNLTTPPILLYATPAEEIVKWPAHRQAEINAAAIRPVNPAEIPQDRTYRNAWTDTGAAIGHDMGKARELHKAALRRVRAPLLAELDVAYIRADEAGDAVAKASIASQKQALRDATDDPAIAAAKTAEELKAAIPEVLR